jgi:hypothetical protein
MGAGVEQKEVASADINSGADPKDGGVPAPQDAEPVMPTFPVTVKFEVSTDPTAFTNFTTSPVQLTPQNGATPVQTPGGSDPNLPTLPDFRASEQSSLATALSTGNLDGVTFSLSDPLPADIFDNPDFWNGAFSFDKDFSFKDYTWEAVEGYTFEGLGDISKVIEIAMDEKAKDVDPKVFAGIRDSFGSLFDSQSTTSTTGTPVKERPLETNKAELAQNVVDAVLNGQPLFHETSGENRGKAYKSRIENTLKLLQEGKLDLNDPEVKKMVVAIARQLYVEAALEPNQVLPFYEMLKMGEFGRNITPEQFEKLVNDLSPDQMKRLLDGSIATLKERLISPPKAWIMNRNGVISDQELDVLRGQRGANPRQVLDVVNKVWTRDEILQSEMNFYDQTGYHTSFYEDTYGYTDYEAGLRAMEARVNSSTDNSAYLSTLTSSPFGSSGGNSYNPFFRPHCSPGSVEAVLNEVAARESEEEEKERKEQQNRQPSWLTGSVLQTPLGGVNVALGPGPAERVPVDPNFRDYISTEQLSQDGQTSPILSTAINLPNTDDNEIV